MRAVMEQARVRRTGQVCDVWDRKDGKIRVDLGDAGVVWLREDDVDPMLSAMCRPSFQSAGSAVPMTGTIAGVGPESPQIVNAAGGKQSAVPYRCDLLPARAVLAVAAVLKAGADKYGTDNWRKIGRADHLNHALTHLLAMQAGDTSDLHLEHAACRLLMALEAE